MNELRIKYLLAIFLIGTGAFFISCDDEEVGGTL